MNKYVVWNGFSKDYVTSAETPVRAIQNAMEACPHFVPSHAWNCANMEEFSPRIQKRILSGAIQLA